MFAETATPPARGRWLPTAPDVASPQRSRSDGSAAQASTMDRAAHFRQHRGRGVSGLPAPAPAALASRTERLGVRAADGPRARNGGEPSKMRVSVTEVHRHPSCLRRRWHRPAVGGRPASRDFERRLPPRSGSGPSKFCRPSRRQPSTTASPPSGHHLCPHCRRSDRYDQDHSSNHPSDD
jgi:hypothetical protein